MKMSIYRDKTQAEAKLQDLIEVAAKAWASTHDIRPVLNRLHICLMGQDIE